MKKIIVLAFVVNLLLMCGVLHAGSFSGKVSWNMQDIPENTIGGEWSFKHPLVDKTKKHNYPAIVAIESVDAPLTVENDKVQVDIIDLEFKHQVYGIRTGVVLNFVNNTQYDLTIELKQNGKVANTVILKSKGGKGNLIPQQGGQYVLQAQEFSNIKSTLLVMDRGRFVNLANDGSFAFKNLDENFYKLKVWAGRWVESEELKLGQKEKVSLQVKASVKGSRLVAINAKRLGSAVDSSSTSVVPMPVHKPVAAPQIEVPKPKAVPKTQPVPSPKVKQPKSRVINKKASVKKKAAKKKAVQVKPKKKTASKKEATKKQAPVKEKKTKKKSGGGLFKIKVID